MRLLPLLSGEALVVAHGLPAATRTSYGDLKQALLDRLGPTAFPYPTPTLRGQPGPSQTRPSPRSLRTIRVSLKRWERSTGAAANTATGSGRSIGITWSKVNPDGSPPVPVRLLLSSAVAKTAAFLLNQSCSHPVDVFITAQLRVEIRAGFHLSRCASVMALRYSSLQLRQLIPQIPPSTELRVPPQVYVQFHRKKPHPSAVV
ncbi:unnamed protein product [Merluccius merluccius]